MRTKILVFSLSLVMAVSLVFAGNVFAEKTFKWKMVTCYPRTEPTVPTMQKYLLDVVKEQSNGRLTIKQYPGGELMKSTEAFEACSNGAIEMVASCGAYWRGIDKIFDFSWGIPYSWRDEREGFDILDTTVIGDLVADGFAKHNLYYLAATGFGHHVFYTNEKIQKVSDWKNLKVRDTGVLLDLYKKLGASPVFLTGSEVYTALQLGTIDGAGWNTRAWDDMHWKEVAKYILLPPVQSHHGELIVNMDAWNSLPDDLKYILKSAAWKAGRMDEQIRIRQERRMYQQLMIESPERVLVMPDAEVAKMRKAAEEVWDNVVAKYSPECARAVEAMKEYLRSNGAEMYEYPIKLD